MRALSIAATGMAAQQTNVEVIANNVANINTTGFKRARAEFTDLLYETERAAGTPATDDETVIPEGNTVGLGVRTAAIRNLHMQGTLARTGNKFDLALNGIGWFQVQGEANEIVYTRDGAFNKNQNGQLVTLDGKLVIPEITVPDTASDVIVNAAGRFMRSSAPPEHSSFWVSWLSPIFPTRRASIRWAAIFSVRRPHQAMRLSATPTTRAMLRSSRAISKIPTSIRSRKSPT